jgi:hypothetical protein
VREANVKYKTTPATQIFQWAFFTKFGKFASRKRLGMVGEDHMQGS